MANKKKSNQKTLVFYGTFPNKKSALAMIHYLLKLKLIACANIVGVGDSVYTWKEKVVKTKECFVFFKTTSRCSRQLKESYLKLHPYDIPCLIELSVKSVNQDYAQWIADSAQ